jgi:hypothetical protein
MRDPRIRAFFKKMGYPKSWIQDGARFCPEDAYIAHDPAWDTFPMPPLPYAPIHDALKRPGDAGKTALACLGTRMSYAELDELSSSPAWRAR